MRVFLTGATGFVGRHILQALLNEGHEVSCLVRPHAYAKIADVKGYVEICSGDAFDLPAIEKGMKGCDAVIHLIGIVRAFLWKGVTFEKYHVEATQNMVQMATKNGIKRFVLMSALGVKKNINTEYMRTKRLMEAMVIDNGFNYTIFRPSVIFGNGDQFIHWFRDMIRRPFPPFVPVVGDGNYPLQPIAVKNVAQAFVRCLNEPRTFGKIYDLVGEDVYSMNQLLDLIGASVGKERPFKLHFPVWFLKGMAFLLQQVPLFPLTLAQIKMLTIGNTSSRGHQVTRDLQIELISLHDYLKSL